MGFNPTEPRVVLCTIPCLVVSFHSTMFILLRTLNLYQRTLHLFDRTFLCALLVFHVIPLFLFLTAQQTEAVEHADCKGIRSPPMNVLIYDTKPSNGEAPVLEAWGIWSMHSFLLLSGPLKPGLVSSVASWTVDKYFKQARSFLRNKSKIKRKSTTEITAS